MSRCQGNRGVSFQKCQIALLSSHFSDNPVSLPLLPPPPLAGSKPPLSSLPRSPEEITGSVSCPALPRALLGVPVVQDGREEQGWVCAVPPTLCIPGRAGTADARGCLLPPEK